jgi:uncharacterized Zn finger protein (UPF0148 family)
MTTITCTKCLLTLDQSLFIKKNGSFYTRCATCREKDNEYVKTKKRKKTDEIQEAISILSYKELDQHLSEMINDIGQEEYFENCESGIQFSCFVDVSFLLNKTPKEIADDVKNFIGKVDGYYYM